MSLSTDFSLGGDSSLGDGFSLGGFGENSDVQVNAGPDFGAANSMERVVRPNLAQVWFAQVPVFIPPAPGVPSAHARWGKASDMRLSLERDNAPYLSNSGGGSGRKQKDNKRNKKPGTYQFQEIDRQTSQHTVTSDDGKCSVTFERIDAVTFRGPQDIHFVFRFSNPG
jgi:hypothetical protein